MLLFNTIVAVFEELEAQTSRNFITEKLAFLFASASPEEAALLAYLSLGSLLPPYQNMVWNLAEKNLLSIIAKLSNQDISIIKTMFKQEGDLGSVAQKILSIIGKDETKKISLVELYDKLNELAHITGTGAQEKKETFLLELFSTQSPLEIKYIIRIINGDLRLGFSEMTLLDAFSWSIVNSKKLKKILEQAYNLSADIGLIIKVLKTEGPAGIQKIHAQPGIPIRPAAAERLAHAEDIIKKIGPCIAQPKLDGLRVQIHSFYCNNSIEIAIFSRNLKDMSHMFPEVTEQAKKLFTTPCIVEGEALAFNEETGQMLPFQVTAKRRRKHAIGEQVQNIPLRVILFDLLYLDNSDLLQKEHDERRVLLEKLVQTTNPVFSVIEEKNIETADQLSDYFEESINVGFEGIVVKKPHAHYQPGTRNFNWIKLKRQESGSLSDTLDCVIIGYYHGQGKRARFGIGAFLVAVYNANIEMFQTIAKIGTGLTDTEWKELKTRCDHHATKEKPSTIDCSPELYPDVWIMPSIVCSIRADEITQSPLHSAGKTSSNNGYALRFPRIMGYRLDKSPAEATTTQEVSDLYTQQKQKEKLLGF